MENGTTRLAGISLAHNRDNSASHVIAFYRVVMAKRVKKSHASGFNFENVNKSQVINLRIATTCCFYVSVHTM